jgi:hypothetical protein
MCCERTSSLGAFSWREEQQKRGRSYWRREEGKMEEARVSRSSFMEEGESR